MGDTPWYYVDRAQRRHGPVPAAMLAAAFRAGQADDASLVWRDGLAEWQPLGAFRDELGLTGEPVSAPGGGSTIPAGPPGGPAYPAGATLPDSTNPGGPAYPGAPAGPARKRTSGCLIAVLVVAALAIPGVAILAAIALPAYMDYVIRAQVGAALADVRRHVPAMEEFRQGAGRCARDAIELGIDEEVDYGEGRSTRLRIGELPGGRCQITGRIVGGNPQLANASVKLTRDASGQWHCTATIARELHLPEGCELD